VKDLITNIFDENGFVLKFNGIVHERPICLFSSDSKRNIKTAHYLVIFIDDINNLTRNDIRKELTQDFYRIEGSIDTTKEMNKNIYILVCAKALDLERDIKLNDSIKKAIFDIEEDPYSFKKYVLPYTDKGVKDLQEEIAKDNYSINDTLYRLINNSSEFMKFKKNIYESTAYELAMKLFIKLPYMKFDVIKKEMNDLSENISLGIAQIGNEERLLVNQITQYSLESIKTQSRLSDEDILKMIGVSK